MPVSNYPFDSRVPRRLILAGRYGHRSSQINAPRGSGASRGPIVNASSDVATRPGGGVMNWEHYGVVLKHRQLELEAEPSTHDKELAIATERMVARELYPNLKGE